MENTIEARWYGCLVLGPEDMDGPISIYTGTTDIVEAYDIALRYERDSHGVFETDSFYLFLDGVEITDDAIEEAFGNFFGYDEKLYEEE